MELLSEACAAVSTPKFPSYTFDERPSQLSDTILAGKQRFHIQTRFFLSFNKRELGNKGQGVMGVKAQERSETQRSNQNRTIVESGGEVECHNSFNNLL